MRSFFFVALLLSTAAATSSIRKFNGHPSASPQAAVGFELPHLKTVDELDLNKFAGRWFQIKENPVSKFLNGATDCNTQDYALLDNGTLSATWSGNKQNTRDIIQRSGNLYRPDEKSPGNLRLKLFGTKLPIEIAFDVVALSSQKAKRYNWAIVTDSLNASLFVLIRDRSKAKDDDFNKKINNQLEELGFNKAWNKPSNVKQGDACKYAPEPKTAAAFFEF